MPLQHGVVAAHLRLDLRVGKMAKDSKPLKTFTGVPLGRSAGDRSSGWRPTRTLAPGATRENGTGSYYCTQKSNLESAG
jgi:hypothetical protein